MRFLKPLLRKKDLAQVNNEESELGRVLSLFDLISLGVGCTLGVGVYVLPGMVAKEIAGPGVVISFFIAALTSVLAGLCFAELGARVPKAGSAYLYSYVTVGEFIAFIIGWNLIVEYIIGTASVARGLSVYIDTLIGNPMEAFYRSFYEFNDNSIFSEYFDFFAFFASFIVTMCLAVGVKESVVINNLLTFTNISVVLFVIGIGCVKADLKNWGLKKEELPIWSGDGGFLPYGISGAIKGAATCFYGYVGFDVICTSGEEVKNPQKALPISIIVSLIIVFLAYFGISAVLTLMWPYYLQDVDAPIPYVFNEVGLQWAAWIVAVGGIFGLLASLYSGMFPLPRIIYSMANDGLLFSIFGQIHERFHTPFIGTVISGLITGLMASLFKLKQLIDLMCLGTLLAYTIVSACVLILRYREELEGPSSITHEYVEHTHLLSKKLRITCHSLLEQMFNIKSVPVPTRITSAVACSVTIIFCLLSTVLSIILVQCEENVMNFEMLPLVFIFLILFIMVLCLVSLVLQPSDGSKLNFQVPWVPLVPALSIFLNIYLMASLPVITWLQFLIWLALGFIIYFSYSINHSRERRINSPIKYEIIRSDDELVNSDH